MTPSLEPLSPALALAALTLGALHTLAPDHWLPFAAVGRARRWSVRRTGLVTALCGVGHVTVSAALALSALWLGAAVMENRGERLTGLTGLLLLAFGATYGLWGLWQATRRRLSGVAHEPTSSRATVSSLFVLFALDPCVPLIPLVVAAAAMGAGAAVTAITLYAAATLGTMTLLAVTARAGAGALRAPWLDRWGHAAAGALILLVGWMVGILEI